MPEVTEIPQPDIPLLNLSVETRTASPAEVKVLGDLIGARVWQEMLQKTRETGKEYGATVRKRGKKITISEITEGSAAQVDPKTGEKISPRVEPSALRDYFKDFISQKIAYIHTHPPEESSGLPLKLRFSKSDIKAYINGRYPAMIMLDSEGVHMLTGFNHDSSLQLPPDEIAKSAYENVSEDSQTSIEVRSKIAQGLSRFGIKYYLSPSLKPSEDGTILFKDVRSQ